MANVLVWTTYAVRSERGGGDVSPRWQLPNYREFPWARAHFIEWNKLRTEYRSFIGWRREDFSGSTITISRGIRHSRGQRETGSVWFLGGSAVWGTGVNDDTTIPSLFHDLTNAPVLNLGEGAYTSRQSLDRLLNTLSIDTLPTAIVSYEGANDVIAQCPKSVTEIPTHYGEDAMREKLRAGRLSSLRTIAIEYLMYVPFRLGFYSSQDEMDCDTNAQKVQQIAHNLVANWIYMKAIASTADIPFYAVLQPTAVTARSRLDQLSRTRFATDQQYTAVLPMVREIAASACDTGRCGSFTDLSAVDFGDSYVFIDDVHLSPAGNRRIAELLSRLVIGDK